jgi:Pectate lyase superfamily protein
VLTELFADLPRTTITSGGTDAPAAGTTETLTPGSGGGFPVVSAASGSQFHIADPAAASELIAVTQTGAAWTVTRGAEGTVPVAHQAGWTALQVVTAGVLGSMVQVVNARAFGATGDGTSDDTAALTAWIGAVNQANATFAVLPPGQYMISGPLPPISAKSVVIVGCGWSYTNFQYGSVISALPSYTSSSAASGSAMVSLAGEGNRLEDVCVDGGGYAPALISVAGGHAQLTRIQAHHVAADGTCVAVGPGGNSCWITDSVINGETTTGNIGLSLNDTDAIIQGCKWDNDYVCLEMLPRAGGAQIIGCHFTPGRTVGQNSIWFNGSPNNVLIASCRFDNSIGSPVQVSPGASTPVNIAIANCLFQSKTLTADTYALVAVDTTNHSVNGLSITNNACYAGSDHLPACFLAAQTQAGAASANPQKIASAGCLCSGNSAWVGTSFYAADSTPTVGRGNVVTTDGSSYSAVPDI